MNMKMIVISALFFSIAAFVNTASAASSSYSSVQTSVSGGSSASAVVNTVIGGTNAQSEVWINGQLVESSVSSPNPVNIPAPEPRPSARENTNRARSIGGHPVSSEIRVQQNIQSVNGSTSGQVHIYRKENGQVVEDRIVPVPPETSGKPFLFRSSASTGTGNARSITQSVLASSSKAVLIRNLSSTTGLPWLLHVPFFSPRGLGVIASTSMSDNLFLSYGEPEPPLQNLIDRIFNMFR